MTNNPTIGGVSRDTIQRAIDVIQQVGYQDKFIDYDLTRNVQVELRALLDAPAVERQEPKAYDFNPTSYARQFIYSAMPPGKYIAVEHYAALQSTIARLEARVAELESEEPEWSVMQQRLGDENEQLRTRIAELESGRGEQIGMLLIDEYFDNREIGEVDVQLDSEACEKLARDFPGQSLPVFVGPTALPERKPVTVGLLSESNTHNQGWNACLDATAALNAPKAAEWHDVAGDDEGLAQ